MSTLPDAAAPRAEAAPQERVHAPAAPTDHVRVGRVIRLRHPGVLGDFAWPGTVGPFKRFSLIYGWNGTGKTTLSEVFRALEARIAPRADVAIVEIDGREVRGEDFPSTTVPVRVFNREYVREGVFPDGGGDLPLILVLGKENVEKQKAITALKEKARRLEAELAAATEEARKADRALEDFCTSSAQSVKNALQATGSEYNNYDKRGFKQRAQTMLDANDSQSHVLSVADREREDARHRGSRKDALTPTDFAFPEWATLSKSVADVIGEAVVTHAIAALKNDAELTGWTKEGLALHEARHSGRCLFCEQPLPAHRLDDLTAHFSTAFREHAARLAAVKEQVAEEIRRATGVVLPKRAELCDDLAGTYQAAASNFETQRTALVASLEAAASLLEEKRKRPFDAMAYDVADPHVDAASVEAVNAIIRQHNDAGSAFETRAAEARKKLEADAVAGALSDYRGRIKEKADKDQAVQTKRSENTATAREIAEAERDIVEHRRPAEDLNADLAKYLGHDELQLAVKENGYEVTREGKPATGLSEGERTAIALLYFLKTLEDRRFPLAEGVVVLDDPVSSLDASALYLAFGFIQSRLKGAGQLLVLTHNFSFFRLMRRWLLKRGPDKKPRKDAALFMLEAQVEHGRRTAALGPLPCLLKDYESEYHYLFSVVLRGAGAVEKQELDGLYVLPNVARRLLEAFLAFRDPRDDGLEVKVMRMRGDEAKKLRVLRFLHVHSHGEGMTEPEHDPSLLAEAGGVLRDLLDLVKEEDPAHYDAMVQLCSADRVTPEDHNGTTGS